jgi:predicted dienelactone hydrolase
MSKFSLHFGALLLASSLLSEAVYAQNRIDTIRPDAPVLATYGDYTLGVRTLQFSHADQIDIVNIDTNKPSPEDWPRYSRPLTAEIWYPATQGSSNSESKTSIEAYMRDGKTQITLLGKAVRDAKPLASEQKFPLVLISHGYPGNRFLMAHLAENIASKGYVVASIDHTDSTYHTLGTFGSTLVNRPLDQLFTLNQIESLSNDPQSFLYNAVDTSNTALIGYSMGAYGAMIMAGASVSDAAIEGTSATHYGALSMHKAVAADPRLKTVVAFAPWGMNHGMWESKALEEVSVPILFIAGSVDDVSGYENGVRALWQGTKNVSRSLLTFNNANHSAGAPMPAPKESFVYSQELGIHLSDHYTDAVWDSTRMNNISQHFVTAWLGLQLKNDDEMKPYLDLIAHSNDGVWSKNEEGEISDEHTHWYGFKNRMAKGMSICIKVIKCC